jgi:hypothetical protein
LCLRGETTGVAKGLSGFDKSPSGSNERTEVEPFYCSLIPQTLPGI